MSDVEITIRLPEALMQRARNVGLRVEDQLQIFADAVEKEIRRLEAGRELQAISREIGALPEEDAMTMDEINEEIRAYRREKREKREREAGNG